MDWGRRNYQQVDTLNPSDLELVETSYGSSSSLNAGDISDNTNLVKRAHSPGVDSETERKPTNKVPGWWVGAVIAASGTLFTLLINLAIAIAIPSIYGLENGISTMYTGNCAWAGKMNTVIHLGVNLLGTLLLSGSNYCMQCLCAPTRVNIDNAHRNRQWLDIGVPSIRNLQAIGTKKLILWFTLGLSSVPLHLLYNSVFFSTITTHNYQVAWVTEGFREGAPFNKTYWQEVAGDLVPLTRLQERSATFDNLTNEECIRAYGQDFITTRRHVLLVVDPGSVREPAPYSMAGTEPSVFNAIKEDSVLYATYHDEGPLSTYIYFWICSGIASMDKCRPKLPSLLSEVANGEVWRPDPQGYRIKYCLSEPYEESCNLQFSLGLIIVVIVCNAGKLAAMTATVLWLHSSKPLITVGDVIDSFMTRNDQSTKGLCLESLENFREYAHNFSAIPFKRQKKRCGQAASQRRWRTVQFLFFLAISIVLILLGYGIACLRGPKDAKSLWDLGFGAVHSSSLIKGMGLPSSSSSGLISAVLLANLPQTILSFLYLLFNGLCTSMLLSAEWGSYQLERKPLRVSDPYGRQRSSYFLQLPYRYAAPLIAMSAALHWGVSQSLFLARINIMDVVDKPQSLSTCGYSPPGMIFTLIMTCLLLCGGAALSYKRIGSDMPIASSCSTAIAAACQTSSLDGCDNDPSMPLQWGVVGLEGQTPDDVGHCCFTAGQVTAPVEGKLYAGLRKRREDTRLGGQTSSNE